MLRPLLLFVTALTSCASIVSKSDWPVIIDSDPPGATITVWDERGTVVHTGAAPARLTLSAKQGYFTKADYQVEARLAGHDPVRRELSASINPWYWGNLVVGGLIGWLIVDPATGAMWKFRDTEVIQLGAPIP